MTSYTNVFGGDNINPSKLTYRSVTLTASVTLVWPSDAQDGANIVADKMDVTPSGAGLVITMPDATLASVGTDCWFRNLGASSFSVVGSAAGAIATVAAGTAWFVYLKTNATAAGTWGVLQAGTGTSTADAATLAGYGLKAITTTLNQSHPVSTTAVGITLTTAYRAQTVVWTGGSGTFAFSAAATLGDDWFALVNNGGTGTLTLNPDSSELINGSATLDLIPDDSCFVVCSGSAFYTVGMGRITSSSITAVEVAGGGAAGTLSLSSTEVAAEIQKFNGTFTGARAFEYGTVAGRWEIWNNLTLAGFLATWRVNGADTGVTSTNIPLAAKVVIVSDGTNMRLASGTVYSVATGTGMTGGTIYGAGTVTLANTAVSPGSYTLANITVDQQGRLTAAASGFAWSAISTNTNAVAGTAYMVSTSVAIVTLTLPATPSVGDYIAVCDAAGTFGTNNLTVARNALIIQGSASDLTCAINEQSFGLVYQGATNGWRITQT